MQVVAITGRKEDYAVAVIEIPEGKTADQTFCMWYRTQYRSAQGRNDQEIMDDNTEYAWVELTVLKA